jgi:hypothetical protein
MTNSGGICGFGKGEFERDSARQEVAAEICVRRANTVQLRAQKIDEATKIRIVVQRGPLCVYEVVRQWLRAREVQSRYSHSATTRTESAAARLRVSAASRAIALEPMVSYVSGSAARLVSVMPNASNARKK